MRTPHFLSPMTCSNTLSHGFSVLLTGLWMCAQIPQIYSNYRHQLTLGLSPGFIGLWFLGDFLSFTLCLFNLVTLPFQLVLAGYFLINDACISWQYWYYGEGSGKYAVPRSPRPSVLSDGVLRASVVAGILGSASRVQAMSTTADKSYDGLGVTLAWMCTVVYVSLRLPQLYHNWRRKSVDGLSPLLFTAALLGNLFYTASILSDCQFEGDDKWVFFVKQLPYILGSSGTVIFDAMYFYQRWLYNKVDETVVLEEW